MSTTRLTGRTRFRYGNPSAPLVLQVEYAEPKPVSAFVVTTLTDWRDAQVEDLAELNALAFQDLKVTVQLPPAREELPGEAKPDPRKLH